MNTTNRLKHKQKVAILSEHCAKVRFTFANGPEILARLEGTVEFTNVTDMTRSELFTWLGY